MPRGGARPVRTNSENKAVSGPGSLSERTDMQPMSAGQVPQSQIPSVPAPKSAPQTVTPPQQLTNLFAPTERPQEPVTAGAPVGPGRTPQPAGRYAMIEKYLPELEALASQPDAPDSFKIFMGLIKSSFNQQGV